MGGDAWTYRQAAMEGSYFRTEQALATRKHLEKMISEGKLSEDCLLRIEAVKNTGLAPQVEYRGMSNLPEHQVKFKYSKAEFPTLSRSVVHQWKLGTQVSLGPGRWSSGEASIWDVKSGKELAQTPSKQATWAEEIRLKKIATAQYESPLVAGYRLLPQFTPGRAFFWGTVLAVWGTSVGSMLVSKAYGINTENMPNRTRELLGPFASWVKGHLVPLKETWSATTPSTTGEAYKVQETPEMFQKLRTMYTR